MYQSNIYQSNNIYPMQTQTEFSYKKYKRAKIKILCNQSKKQIDENIQKILHTHCNLGVYGYNIFEDEYWGKKYENINNVTTVYTTKTKNCILHFKLKIMELDDENSSIVLLPEFGSNDIEIKNLEIILQKFLAKKCINEQKHIMCPHCELIFQQNI